MLDSGKIGRITHVHHVAKARGRNFVMRELVTRQSLLGQRFSIWKVRRTSPSFSLHYFLCRFYFFFCTFFLPFCERLFNCVNLVSMRNLHRSALWSSKWHFRCRSGQVSLSGEETCEENKIEKNLIFYWVFPIYRRFLVSFGIFLWDIFR